MKNEKQIKASNGYVMLLVLLVVIMSMVAGLLITKNPIF